MAQQGPGAIWIVACACEPGESERLLNIVSSEATRNQLCMADFPPKKFDVPESLKFSAFDNLVKLSDDLAKADSGVEQVLRRIERQLLDIDPNAERAILSQRQQMPWAEYVRNFPWDDAKFPRSRSINDSIQLLQGSVSRLDEEVRTRSSSYADLKSQISNAEKRDGGTFAMKDLTEVLTPENTLEEDFINTQHLMTVVVVVPRGQDKEWLKSYEKFSENVVPMSTKKFAPLDKEQNSLWRVVLFQSALEPFKKACREKKYIVRDNFAVSKADYAKFIEEKQSLQKEMRQQETFLMRVCQAAFSDCLVSWMHLKAIRTYVEATLRSGISPHDRTSHFAAFAMKPSPKPNKQKQLHQLMSAVCKQTDKNFGGAYMDQMGNKEEGGEDYYPYVFFQFSPVAI